MTGGTVTTAKRANGSRYIPRALVEHCEKLVYVGADDLSEVSTRDEAFLRALLHDDYLKMKRTILDAELAFLQSNPGTPFYVKFDYGTLYGVCEASVEAVSAFPLDNPMWRHQNGRARTDGLEQPLPPPPLEVVVVPAASSFGYSSAVVSSAPRTVCHLPTRRHNYDRKSITPVITTPIPPEATQSQSALDLLPYARSGPRLLPAPLALVTALAGEQPSDMSR
ncbi:hypothetical protein K438DRAFT_2028353 [Mycena galopus ATCC 62051]|nr:hypothetical protein K438DRAFT_2028353 [Mycena galopus ATCC 62051]